MLITYCDKCGRLIRVADHLSQSNLCGDCAAGHCRKPFRIRDSAQIPYAQRPSTGAILREIQASVHRP